MKKVHVLLEVDLKAKGWECRTIHTYRKEAIIHMEPFPGLVIDDNDCFKKGDIGITPHQVAVGKVRCQMVTDNILCYCEDEVFEHEEDLNERVKLLKRLNWYAAGPHG